MGYLAIKFPLPKPAAPVAQRELTVVVNNQPARVYLLPGDALVSDQILFANKDSFRVSLVDIDASGNRSPASKVFSDEVSTLPAKPGDLPPLLPEHKQFLNDEDAKKVRAEALAKFEADQKAAVDKATADAKALEDRNAAIAKIDADAAEAKAKVQAPGTAPFEPAPFAPKV
jgi:hypothetical protein